MVELKHLNKYFLKYKVKIIIGILITIIARIFALVAPNLIGDSITVIENYLNSSSYCWFGNNCRYFHFYNETNAN
jgi:ATP-binding cassette subfamily B protein